MRCSCAGRSRRSSSDARSTAAGTRTACARARSTCPASSASARRRRSARARCRTRGARLAALRDRLLAGLRANLDGVHVNGSLTHRLPHNLHVSFDGVEGEGLLMALGDLAVSTGSACSSGSQAPSHVLQAIGAVGDGVGAVGPLRPRPRHHRTAHPVRHRSPVRRGQQSAPLGRRTLTLHARPEGRAYRRD